MSKNIIQQIQIIKPKTVIESQTAFNDLARVNRKYQITVHCVQHNRVMEHSKILESH